MQEQLYDDGGLSTAHGENFSNDQSVPDVIVASLSSLDHQNNSNVFSTTTTASTTPRNFEGLIKSVTDHITDVASVTATTCVNDAPLTFSELSRSTGSNTKQQQKCEGPLLVSELLLSSPRVAMINVVVNKKRKSSSSAGSGGPLMVGKQNRRVSADCHTNTTSSSGGSSNTDYVEGNKCTVPLRRMSVDYVSSASHNANDNGNNTTRMSVSKIKNCVEDACNRESAVVNQGSNNAGLEDFALSKYKNREESSDTTKVEYLSPDDAKKRKKLHGEQNNKSIESNNKKRKLIYPSSGEASSGNIPCNNKCELDTISVLTTNGSHSKQPKIESFAAKTVITNRKRKRDESADGSIYGKSNTNIENIPANKIPSASKRKRLQQCFNDIENTDNIMRNTERSSSRGQSRVEINSCSKENGDEVNDSRDRRRSSRLDTSVQKSGIDEKSAKSCEEAKPAQIDSVKENNSVPTIAIERVNHSATMNNSTNKAILYDTKSFNYRNNAKACKTSPNITPSSGAPRSVSPLQCALDNISRVTQGNKNSSRLSGNDVTSSLRDIRIYLTNNENILKTPTEKCNKNNKTTNECKKSSATTPKNSFSSTAGNKRTSTTSKHNNSNRIIRTEVECALALKNMTDNKTVTLTSPPSVNGGNRSAPPSLNNCGNRSAEKNNSGNRRNNRKVIPQSSPKNAKDQPTISSFFSPTSMASKSHSKMPNSMTNMTQKTPNKVTIATSTRGTPLNSNGAKSGTSIAKYFTPNNNTSKRKQQTSASAGGGGGGRVAAARKRSLLVELSDESDDEVLPLTVPTITIDI